MVGREVEILTDEADFRVLLLWECLGTRGTHRHLALASPPHRSRREQYGASASLAPTPQGDTSVPQVPLRRPRLLLRGPLRQKRSLGGRGLRLQRAAFPRGQMHLPTVYTARKALRTMFPISPGFPGLQDSGSGRDFYSAPNNLCLFKKEIQECDHSTYLHTSVVFKGSFPLMISFDHLDNPRDTFNWFFEDSWVSRNNLFKHNTPRRDSTLNFY